MITLKLKIARNAYNIIEVLFLAFLILNFHFNIDTNPFVVNYGTYSKLFENLTKSFIDLFF